MIAYGNVGTGWMHYPSPPFVGPFLPLVREDDMIRTALAPRWSRPTSPAVRPVPGAAHRGPRTLRNRLAVRDDMVSDDPGIWLFHGHVNDTSRQAC